MHDPRNCAHLPGVSAQEDQEEAHVSVRRSQGHVYQRQRPQVHQRLSLLALNEPADQQRQ